MGEGVDRRKQYELIVYKAKDGHRWRLVCVANKKIIADGAEAYYNRRTCLRAANRLLKILTEPERIVLVF